MEAKVYIVDKSEARLKELQAKFGDRIIPLVSDDINLENYVAETDLLIGGVLIPGANAPKLITKDMLKVMKRGSVIVDVAIDQGGCVETSKPTTMLTLLMLLMMLFITVLLICQEGSKNFHSRFKCSNTSFCITVSSKWLSRCFK